MYQNFVGYTINLFVLHELPQWLSRAALPADVHADYMLAHKHPGKELFQSFNGHVSLVPVGSGSVTVKNVLVD